MQFPKQRRITRAGEFDRVKKQGESVGGSCLVLGYLYDPDSVDSIQVGYITTKRIGNAVVRNRVRRKLRGILQRTGESVKQGHYLVLIARNRAANASSEALEKEWKWLLHKAKLWQETPEPEA